MRFVANFLRFSALQIFWKSVKTWQSYREFKGGNFSETRCIFSSTSRTVRPAATRSSSDRQSWHRMRSTFSKISIF